MENEGAGPSNQVQPFEPSLEDIRRYQATVHRLFFFIETEVIRTRELERERQREKRKAKREKKRAEREMNKENLL